MFLRSLAATAVTLVACPSVSAQPALLDRVDALAANPQIPAAAIVSVRCGQVETAVSGHARLDSLSPVGPAGRFNLGSNSKSFLAIAAARLIEAGQMSWSQTVASSGAFPSLPIDSPYASVTLSELLSHTAGIATYHTGDVLASVEVTGPPETHARQFAEQALSAPPAGPRGVYAYSNAGPVIAALMLEAAAHADWISLIDAQVFETWGLDAGLADPQPADGGQPYGHYPTDEGLAIWDNADPEIDPFLQPSGYLSITPDSYGRYLELQVCGLAGQDSPEISAQSVQYVHTPLYDTPAALGWGRTELGDATWSVHIGSTGAHYAFAALNEDSAYAVLVNSGAPEAGAAAQAALVQLITGE